MIEATKVWTCFISMVAFLIFKFLKNISPRAGCWIAGAEHFIKVPTSTQPPGVMLYNFGETSHVY